MNCADTASAAALAYDWTYHAFDDESQKRDLMASVLYEKGLKMGYLSMIKRPQDGINYHSFVNNYQYYNTQNNWNTVCNAGMILSALVLYEREEYRTAAEKVAGDGLASLKKCLLQYAPDGAYIESPGYWYYGTSTYMILLAALDHAAGTTYGYLDTIGLYDSFYFAQYITSPSGYYWNYHDSGRSTMTLDLFYMASSLYGDANLAAYRDASLKSGGYGSLYDILYYSPDLSAGGESGGALDYYMKGIETVTMRSQWSGEGYSFAGLHAGANIATHGDHDSGNFYLEMGGVLWFGDAGAEDYNVADYWGTERRYRYFTKSQEAHNTIVIRSDDNALRFGQVHNTEYQTHATIEAFRSEENGAYAVADMTPQYGDACLSGKRGLLFTNARRTVVLQDEISFSEPTSLTWLAAPNLSACTLRIAEDGRTAYLTSNNATGKKKILRLTLLSEDESLVFTTVEEKLLDYTIVKDDANPKASTATTRLAIHADDITSFCVSVVFDLVEEKDDILGYEACDIADWSITDDTWLNEAQDAYDKTKPNQYYMTGDLVMAVAQIEAETDPSRRAALIAAAYAICADMDPKDATAAKYIQKYMTLLDEINALIRKANQNFRTLNEQVLTKHGE